MSTIVPLVMVHHAGVLPWNVGGGTVTDEIDLMFAERGYGLNTVIDGDATVSVELTSSYGNPIRDLTVE